MTPVPWIVLRFLTGVCIAGLFIVSESWLNDVATTSTRATLLAVYNTVVTAGLAIGSLLLNAADTNGVRPVRGRVGAVVDRRGAGGARAARGPDTRRVPIDLDDGRVPRRAARSQRVGRLGPRVPEPRSAIGAVYATRAGFGVSGASQFVAAVLLGAVLGQIPLGRWSDRTDRRIVMGAASALLVAGSGVGFAGTTAGSFSLVLGAAFLIGAGAFSLYGLSFAHLADYIDPATMVSAGARVMIANGLGAAAGPFLASIALTATGPEGLFGLLGAAGVLFCGFVVWRMTRREAVSEERRAHYVSVAASSTFAALDDVFSEAAGVEPADLHRRKIRRPPLPRMPRRRPPG